MSGCTLSRCCRTVCLHKPVDKLPLTFATSGPADRKRLILEDTKLDQIVPDTASDSRCVS